MNVKRRTVAVVAIAAGLLCLTAVLATISHIEHTLRSSERALDAREHLAVSIGSLPAQPTSGFEGVSAPAVFKGGAAYNGHFYLSGPTGLFQYTIDGSLEHVYRVGLDLPASPLGQILLGTLADARQPELLIATSGAGVIAFDGKAFRQIRPADADARQITALLPLDSGRLLLGTSKRGLLIYDGQDLKRFHPTTDGISVTALAGTESDLWIGTNNEGVFHWRGGQVDHISEAQGLPDAHIESIALKGERVFIGTPVGVAELRQNESSQAKAATIWAAGRYAHALYADEDALLVGEMEGGVTRISFDQHATEFGPRRPIRALADPTNNRRSDPDETPIEQFLAVGTERYAVTGNGLLQLKSGSWNKVLTSGPSLLTDRNVSALMVAADGRTWVGYFDRGLDIIPAMGGTATHIEDEQIFCVNRILEDRQKGFVAVATANGLVLFDYEGHRKQLLDHDSGLIASHVTDVALYGNGMVAATPAGITFLDSSGNHSMYAFQGLVNNHVYALSATDNRLLVGTLGGLSLLTNDAVTRNLTTATSGLKHNWITSLAIIGPEWLIGTYGAGVLRMSAAGTISTTDATKDGVIVNPGAMLVDGNLVLAGTLGQGLLVGDADGTRWRTVTSGLPSLNVTALAVNKGTVYVGTDNGLVKIAEDKL